MDADGALCTRLLPHARRDRRVGHARCRREASRAGRAAGAQSVPAARDDRRLVFRFRLAVCVPAKRAARIAAAARFRSATGRSCSPGSSARTGRRARPKSPRSARSPIASASGARRHSASRCDSRRSIRSIRCRCFASRSPAIRSADAVHRIFRFVWRDGRLPDLPIEWAELAGALGVPDADARIATAEVKDELRRNTDEAIARGVFGVPTLAIGDELFWGADATAMAADYVAAGCRFDDPEYARVARRCARSARRAAKPAPSPSGKPDHARGDERVDRRRVDSPPRAGPRRRAHPVPAPAGSRVNSWPETLNGGAYSREPSSRVRTISRAMNCRSLIASSSVATGVTQQSTDANLRVHSASVRLGEDALELAAHAHALVAQRELTRRRDRAARLRRTARARTFPPARPRRASARRASDRRRSTERRRSGGRRRAAARVPIARARAARRCCARATRRSSRRRRNARGRSVRAPTSAARSAMAADAAPPSRSAICRLDSAGGPSRTPVWSSTPA